jgi:hypothetical protein
MACPLGARVMALCQQAASLTNPKDPVGCTLVMSALALRVWHGESRCRVTIQTTWSVDELVANLRDKLRVAADAKVRTVCIVAVGPASALSFVVSRSAW